MKRQPIARSTMRTHGWRRIPDSEASNPVAICALRSSGSAGGAPGDENSFRAYDLNQALSPTAEMVCTPADLRGVFHRPVARALEGRGVM